MQKLLKKFIFLNLKSLELSKTKFYCFYPLQSGISRERLLNTNPKISFNKNKIKNLLKYPLKLRKFNDSKKMFLSVKNFQTIYVRHKNFCCVSYTKIFDRYFDVNCNFNLIKNSVIFFIHFMFFLKNFERHFLSILFLMSNKN